MIVDLWFGIGDMKIVMMLDENDEQVVWTDPDRPPLSSSDLRKI